MALIIEDGTIVPNAQSYIDLAFTDSYWEQRGDPEQWTCLNPEEQEAAILYATQYVEKRYRFRGQIQDRNQVLAFPRTPFCDREGRALAGEGVIPEPVKQAVAELALRQAIEDLFLDTDPSAKTIIRKKVEDAEEELDSTRDTTRFKYIDMLLMDYLSGDDSCINMVRG